MEQMQNLFFDVEIFGNPDNLMVNGPDDTNGNPFHPLDERSELCQNIGEFMTGEWYRDTVKKLIKDPDSEMLIPCVDLTDIEHVPSPCYSFDVCVGLTEVDHGPFP